jgi:hypothetical protein
MKLLGPLSNAPSQSTRSVRAHDLACDLGSYYEASVTGLATALGTTRDTARAWLEAPPNKPRQELLDRAERLSLLCRAASRYLLGRAAVGRWTLAPHLSLHGESPAQALLARGDEGLTWLLMEMASVAPARPDLPLAQDEEALWEKISETLGADDLARIERILQAPELDVDDRDLADLAAFEE